MAKNLASRTILYSKTDAELRTEKVARAKELLDSGYEATSTAHSHWSFRLTVGEMVATARVFGGGAFPEELVLVAA